MSSITGTRSIQQLPGGLSCVHDCTLALCLLQSGCWQHAESPVRWWQWDAGGGHRCGGLRGPFGAAARVHIPGVHRKVRVVAGSKAGDGAVSCRGRCGPPNSPLPAHPHWLFEARCYLHSHALCSLTKTTPAFRQSHSKRVQDPIMYGEAQPGQIYPRH